MSDKSKASETARSWLAHLALVPVLPWLLVGVKYSRLGDTIVRQHDNLDGFQAILSRMTWADLFAAPGTTLPYLLGGLPRDSFGSELFLANLIGVALPLLWSLFVTEFLIRTLAFYGMRALLKTAGIGDYKIIVYGTATVFALLPFFTPAFGAVAAAPFLLAAFLRTLDSRRLDWRSGAVFALFPLVAPVYVTIPYVAFLLLVIVALIPSYRTRVRPALLGLGILSVSTLVVDWRIFSSVAFGPTSHRAAMGTVAQPIGWSLFTGFGDSVFGEVFGDVSHSPVGKSRFLAYVLVFALILLVFGWRRIDRRRKWLIVGLVGSVIVAAVVERLWHPFEVRVLAAIFDNWGRFQMERVRWIEPTVIYFLLALALTVVADLIDWERTQRWLVAAFLVLVLSIQGWIVVSMQWFIERPSSLTVSEYYAPETMSEIKDAFVATGGHLAVSVGLHPAVAIANGIDSADGYFNAYPLEYKDRFRRLIAPALEATEENRSYFDNWGSRAYVFQPDLPRPGIYAPTGVEIPLVVEPAAFDELDVTHVISSSPLNNAEAVGLELVLMSGSSDELGPIWLYRVQ